MPESIKYYINSQPLKLQNYIRFNELLMGKSVKWKLKNVDPSGVLGDATNEINLITNSYAPLILFYVN